VQTHVEKGARMLEPVGGALGRIIPIILAHHDKFDGNGYTPTAGEDIPMGARILTVADNYDAMTSDRPYRKAMSPFDAKEIIEKGSGKDFDPEVVKAFLRSFSRRELEVPEFVLD
jgi:HD-GYP domain-containing protein (c-di-GMP phosphodiesterase class II)